VFATRPSMDIEIQPDDGDGVVPPVSKVASVRRMAAPVGTESDGACLWTGRSESHRMRESRVVLGERAAAQIVSGRF
jgi:hypothetical protein